MKLIPTKNQFENWSLPTRAGYIAFVITIATGIITVIIFLIQLNVGASKEGQKKTHEKLDKLIPKAHASPELEFSLQRISSNFAPGIQVDGLTWEADFSQYFLKIKAKKAKIQDLRIDIDFLGGVVKKEIRLQEGIDVINFSADSFLNTGIGKNGQIYKAFLTYSNNLKISCPEIYQDGYFEIKLILKDLGITKNGLFEVSYRYFDENNEQKKWANRYKILRHQNEAMYIDSKNPSKDAVKRSLQMMPKNPLIFKKDGSVEEKK